MHRVAPPRSAPRSSASYADRTPVTGNRRPETAAEGRARRARRWARWRRPATAAALIGYGLVVAAFYIIATRTGRADLLQPRHPGFFFLAGFPYCCSCWASIGCCSTTTSRPRRRVSDELSSSAHAADIAHRRAAWLSCHAALRERELP